MIRTALIASFASCLALSALAADKREERAVSGYHAIATGVVMDLDVIQDGTESVALEGDPEVLARIETVVRDGTLEFKYKRDTEIRNPGRVHGTVHARDMNGIALSGAGHVRSPGLKADAMALAISGSGDMDIGRISSQRASLNISGSGNLNVGGGNADELKVAISGSGTVKAGKLESQRANVGIAGAGNATVWAKQQLASAISGVGNVRYYGDPQVTQSVRGVGHVERVAANP